MVPGPAPRHNAVLCTLRPGGVASAVGGHRPQSVKPSRRTDYAAEYAHDARALASHAHQLRLAVEDRATDSEVRAAFDRVRRSYHAVRDEVAHSDSRVARRDLGPVTDSYRAVEHELGLYPDRDESIPPT